MLPRQAQVHDRVSVLSTAINVIVMAVHLCEICICK